MTSNDTLLYILRLPRTKPYHQANEKSLIRIRWISIILEIYVKLLVFVSSINRGKEVTEL